MQQTREEFPYRCFASNVGGIFRNRHSCHDIQMNCRLFETWDDIFNKEVRNIDERNTAEDENVVEDSENAEPLAVGFNQKGGLYDQNKDALFKLLKKR